MTAAAESMAHDRRSRRFSLAFASAFILFGVSIPVAGALGQGVELWMIPMALVVIGSALNIVLREFGRSREGIVVGWGLIALAASFNLVRAAVDLASESANRWALANVSVLLVSAALLVWVLIYAHRSYRSA